MQKFIELIQQQGADNWSDRAKGSFDELFGTSGGRYPEKGRNAVRLRAPEFKTGSGVPFAAIIHPSNPDSGAYGGMSLVVFPIAGGSCLLAMVVGTQGLSPDEEVLGRPGHGRKVSAICTWLNKKHGQGQMLAWAKQDPVRIDLDIPDNIKRLFPEYSSIFEKYGRVIYGLFAPTVDQEATEDALKAFMDLMFAERGISPLKSATAQGEEIQAQYFADLMPDIEAADVQDILMRRRFVILQGPPGTGKTRMALNILQDYYSGRGASIQFHPNTTYESFIGGLSPVQNESAMGFRFAPQSGFLMEAAREAMAELDKPYLLHIDEINRADLAKVLGEAIFLMEPQSQEKRELSLPYDFGEPFNRKLWLPPNLHILGTMNSSDRSIAIVDIAVRRRLGFIKLWPQLSVVQANACELMQRAFRQLLSIFVEHASDDALDLVPGHSYFLEQDEKLAVQHLRLNLAPLLEEYLVQGYVAGFAAQVRAYLQWIESQA